MRILRTLGAFILSMIAVPLFTAAACNFAFAQSIYSTETYETILADARIIEDLRGIALPILAEVEQVESENTVSSEGALESPVRFSDIRQALNADAWIDVTNLLVPDRWLRERSNQVIALLDAIVTGNFDILNSTVDLSVIRQRLTGDEAQQAVQIILDEAPECTRTQIDRLRTLATTGSGQLPICNPPAQYRSTSESILTEWLNSLAALLQEDTLTVQEFFRVQTDDLRALHLIINLDIQAVLLTFLCPAALLSLVVILAVKNFRSFGRWVGGTSLVTSAVIFAVIVLAQMWAFNSIATLINPRSSNSEIGQFGTRLLVDSIRALFSSLNAVMLAQAGVFLIIGFLLVAATIISAGDEKDNSVLLTEKGKVIATAAGQRTRPGSPLDVE